MRKYLVVFIAMAVIAAGGTAWADTNTLTVRASVRGTCMFSSRTSTLDFGTLDPSNPALVNGSGSTTFWCTKNVGGSTFSIGDGLNWNGSNRQMLGPYDDVIPYSLTAVMDGLANGGPNVTRTVTFSGSVQADDYTGKSAGAYTDTVVLTLTP